MDKCCMEPEWSLFLRSPQEEGVDDDDDDNHGDRGSVDDASEKLWGGGR